ncbi:MAG: hypothetical protein GY711_07570 [bacterium]|nr:hypothetical protein [bacterium]
MPRLAAWQILRSGSTMPLREVDRFAEWHSLDPRDRGLLRRLVGTEVRRRGTLRAIVNAFTNTKPTADVAAHLRLGFVQLFFMDRVPPHAAVSETVGAARNTLGAGRARFVNGVLRTVLRERKEGSSGDPQRDLVGSPWHFEQPLFRNPEEHVTLWIEDALSIPAALAKRWIKRFGREPAIALCARLQDEATLSVRVVNTGREALQAELAAADIETKLGPHPRTLRIDSKALEKLIASDAFARGAVAVQGETALAAAELVEASAGERILELCAAPGGKTCVLAGTGAQVLALDLSQPRLARASSELERLDLHAHVKRVASDGGSALADALFDGVLVDAPCSNTGVLDKRPGARWRFGPATQRDLKQVQARLVQEGAAHVRPGGRLVYSTCSLEPEENGRTVRDFLAANEGWELEVEIEAVPIRDEDPVDGGYAARLRRART